MPRGGVEERGDREINQARPRLSITEGSLLRHCHPFVWIGTEELGVKAHGELGLGQGLLSHSESTHVAEHPGFVDSMATGSACEIFKIVCLSDTANHVGLNFVSVRLDDITFLLQLRLFTFKLPEVETRDRLRYLRLPFTDDLIAFRPFAHRSSGGDHVKTLWNAQLHLILCVVPERSVGVPVAASAAVYVVIPAA